jgi:hypothetical protein
MMALSTVAFAAEFKDMPNDWSTSALEAAVKNGLLTGSGGYIKASDNMTRAEMATIMVRACGATKEVDISGYVVNIDQHGDTFLLTNSPVKPSLPQTGVLWWPVPVLAAAGLVFLIAGHLLRGRRKDA